MQNCKIKFENTWMLDILMYIGNNYLCCFRFLLIPIGLKANENKLL